MKYVLAQAVIINTIDWVAITTNIISHSSGGREVQGQGTVRAGVWCEPVLWLVDGCLLFVHSYSRRERKKEEDLFL